MFVVTQERCLTNPERWEMKSRWNSSFLVEGKWKPEFDEFPDLVPVRRWVEIRRREPLIGLIENEKKKNRFLFFVSTRKRKFGATRDD